MYEAEVHNCRDRCKGSYLRSRKSSAGQRTGGDRPYGRTKAGHSKEKCSGSRNARKRIQTMSKTYVLLGVTLVSLFVISGPTRVEADSVGGGILQFRTNFNEGVEIVNRSLSGRDGSPGALESSWDNIGNVLPWLQGQQDFNEGGSVQISADPTDPTNRVLHLHNFTFTKGDKRSRSQYSLTQVPSGKWDQLYGENIFDKQFYRYRMFIPGDITTVVETEQFAPWYMIWEAHSWQFDPVRHGIYLRKKAKSDAWRFRVVQEHHEGPDAGTVIFEIDDIVDVPFDRWFTLEIFFKYHPTEGEFYVGIVDDDGKRQIAARIQGQTQFGEKMRDQMIFKLYHNVYYTEQLIAKGGDGTHQYYDSFEIWDDYPAGYWRMPAPTNLEISLE